MMESFIALTLFLLVQQQQEFGDYGYLHEQFHHFYQRGENGGPIMRPHQPSTACCNGDCRPTKSRRTANGWEAWVNRKWMKVPDDRIKRNIKSPNGTAHICSTMHDPVTIHCFIPPEIET